MITYILGIIPRIQQYSRTLDDLTRIMNQHWVVLDEISNSKVVYIFRGNNQLLIARNGIIEHARWEYLGDNSMMISIGGVSYLFRNGFLDNNILALKKDSSEGYAILVNESRYDGELNTIECIQNFLTREYIERQDVLGPIIPGPVEIIVNPYNSLYFKSKKGVLEIRTNLSGGYTYGDLAFINNETAPDGKYQTGWPACLSFVIVEDGKLIRI